MSSLLAIAGILLIAYITAMVVVKYDIYYAIALSVVVTVGIILSKKFELGIFLLFVVAPFNRGGTPDVVNSANMSTGIPPNAIALVFLTAFYVLMSVLRGKLTLVKTRLTVPIIVFIGVAALSVIAATYLWDPGVKRYDKQLLYQISEIGLWALCFVAFFITSNAVKNKAWLSALFWPVVLIALYVGILTLANIPLPFKISRNLFIESFASILITARLFFGQDRPAGKFGLAMLGLLFLLVTFLGRSWVSGWATAVTGIMVILFLYSRKLFAGVAVAGLALVLLYPGFISSIYSESRQEGDLDRFTLWSDSAKMAIANNPVLGIGPADYIAYRHKYASVWYGYTTYTTAHSDYAQIIAELGLLGIAAFLWLIVAGVRTGLDSAKKSPKGLKWLAVGGTAVFAAIAVTSLFGDYLLPSRVNGGIWSFGTSIFPWLLLGTAVAAGRQNEEGE